jgi:SAM-dependent methyltransferase
MIPDDSTRRTTDTPSSTTLHEYERDTGNDQAATDYWARTRRRIISDWIADIAPTSVLDLGCGSGYLADHLSTTTETVIGLDIDTDSVALAHNRPGVRGVVVGDARALPFYDDTFDCLLVGDVLEHFDDPVTVLAEAQRVLNADGSVVVSVPAFRWLWGPHDEHNDHTDRNTPDRLGTLAGQAGFQMTDYRFTNFFPLVPYFLIQRVLKTGVPAGTRGGHSAALEAFKDVMIRLEERIRFPIGITLIARLDSR